MNAPKSEMSGKSLHDGEYIYCEKVLGKFIEMEIRSRHAPPIWFQLMHRFRTSSCELSIGMYENLQETYRKH